MALESHLKIRKRFFADGLLGRPSPYEPAKYLDTQTMTKKLSW